MTVTPASQLSAAVAIPTAAGVPTAAYSTTTGAGTEVKVGAMVSTTVTVLVQVEVLPDESVAPSTAVQNGPNGQYVFVVRPDRTVALREVKVARTEGDDSVVTSGLAAGDVVVTAGQLRLAPGTRVTTGGARET